MKSIFWRLLVIFQIMLLIIAFSNCEKDLTTPTSNYSLKEIEIRVMSYNILESGGAIPEIGNTTNRMPEIISIVRKVNPDFLGLQEAWMWDSFDPPYYKTVAEALDMKYFHYLEYEEVEYNGLCVYSKYPIESTDYMLHQSCSPNQEWNGAYMLKTVIRIDSITTVDILNCHLVGRDYDSPIGTQTCELESLNEYLKDSIKQNTILMGDFNTRYSELDSTGRYHTQLLVDAGLLYLSPTLDDSSPTPTSEHNKPLNTDQIWVSKNLFTNYSVYDYFNMEKYLGGEYLLELLPDASDHYPVIGDILISN